MLEVEEPTKEVAYISCQIFINVFIIKVDFKNSHYSAPECWTWNGNRIYYLLNRRSNNPYLYIEKYLSISNKECYTYKHGHGFFF